MATSVKTTVATRTAGFVNDAEVDVGADRHEEERGEEPGQRLEPLLETVVLLDLGQDDAGQEGADDGRQPRYWASSAMASMTMTAISKKRPSGTRAIVDDSAVDDSRTEEEEEGQEGDRLER